MKKVCRMDVRRKCVFCVLLTVITIFISGCRENSVETDKAVTLTWQTVNERVQKTSRLTDYDTTAQNGITYYFESGVLDEEDRLGYIADVNTFYCKVRELLPDTANRDVTIYVGNSLTTQGVSEKAFIQPQDMLTCQGMTAVLLSAMSETVNYGQAYGITAYLCRESGLHDYVKTPQYSDDELAAYYENQDNLCLLDFFLPVFEAWYVDEETAEYVQAGAVSFEEYYIGQTGLENALLMCAQSSQPELDRSLEKEKNEWLEAIGAEGAYQAVSYVIPFSHNLNDNRDKYPYIIFTESAEWFPALADVVLMGYADFIGGFAETLQYQEADFAQAREVLHDYIESGIPAVTIYTNFADDSDLSQIYGAIYFAGNYIRLYQNWDIAQCNLLHEYVHYLTMRHGTNKVTSGFWAEGIAEETAMMECDNRLAGLYMDRIMTEENIGRARQAGLWDYEESKVDVRLLRMAEAFGVYMGYANDREYLSVGQKVIVRTADMAEGISPNWLSYSEAAGMIAYLMETYGKDMVFENSKDVNRLETVYGKSFSELYNEWAMWNIQKLEEAGIDVDTLAGLYL